MTIERTHHQTHTGWLWGIITAWLVMDILFLWLTSSAWWDSGMYVGMGKFLFSGGEIGMWELFRPPLMPILFGAVWSIGLNPVLFGTILGCASVVGIMVVIYKTSEIIYPSSGIIASTLFGWTPIVLVFTSAQLSDLPSTFLATLAVYYLLKDKSGYAGLSAGLAFLLRFPAGLIILPMLIYSLLRLIPSVDAGTPANHPQIKEDRKKIFRNSLHSVFVLAGTFSVLPIAYLISNFFVYGNAISPLLAGTQFSVSGILNPNHFFYIAGLLTINPFFIFGLILIVMYVLYIGRDTIRGPRQGAQKLKDPMTLIILSLIILTLYFSLTPHKEIRYSIAFIPYLSILAGGAITILLTSIMGKFSARFSAYTIFINSKNIYLYASIALIAMFTIANVIHINKEITSFRLSPEYVAYYDFFKDKDRAKVISTSPQLSLFSNVKNISISDTPGNLLNALSVVYSPVDYSIHKDAADYIAIDSCNVHTPDSKSKEELEMIISDLEATTITEYDATSVRMDKKCRLLVFRVG